jgi:hypothetical protein
MILPALAGALPPRPDSFPVPASPDRETESVLPPPVAALDNLFADTPAGGFAGVSLWPGVEQSFAVATEQDHASAWLRLGSKPEALLGADDWWVDGLGKDGALLDRTLWALPTA